MPNWCNNVMTISHPDPAMIQKAADAWNESKFLATLVPEPDYSVTPVAKTFPELSAQFAKTEEEKEAALKNEPAISEDSWWDWRVQNWGTKWDIGYSKELDNLAEIQDGEFKVFFDSAWSPPCGAYQSLEDKGFKIKAHYYEPGCGFVGYWECGVDECYSVPADPEDIEAEIPDFMINEWDLVETALSYRD